MEYNIAATFTYIYDKWNQMGLRRSFAVNQDFPRELAKLLLGNIPIRVTLMILCKYSQHLAIRFSANIMYPFKLHISLYSHDKILK